LKLEYDEALSNFAFNFNVRPGGVAVALNGDAWSWVRLLTGWQAGAYTRPRFSST
jgi:hypothetical protein